MKGPRQGLTTLQVKDQFITPLDKVCDFDITIDGELSMDQRFTVKTETVKTTTVKTTTVKTETVGKLGNW